MRPAPSPRRGEGWGEGATIERLVPPHPHPLPDGERESRRAALGVCTHSQAWPGLKLGMAVDARPHVRHRPHARWLAGAHQLPAALPGPALRAAQRLRHSCVRADAVGRVRNQCRLLDPDRIHRDRDLPLPHPRALRHGRPPGARPLPRRAPMSLDAVTAILLIPALAAALMAALPGYRATARFNVL